MDLIWKKKMKMKKKGKLPTLTMIYILSLSARRILYYIIGITKNKSFYMFFFSFSLYSIANINIIKHIHIYELDLSNFLFHSFARKTINYFFFYLYIKKLPTNRFFAFYLFLYIIKLSFFFLWGKDIIFFCFSWINGLRFYQPYIIIIY